VDAWVGAGLAALTGRSDGPALVPADDVLLAIGALVGEAPVEEPLVLLGERAALVGATRRGSTSVGGGTRLLPTADGWLALNLSRSEDVALLPAWLGLAGDPDDPWAAVESAVAERSGSAVEAAGATLGLAVAVVSEARAGDGMVVRHHVDDRPVLDRPPIVLDLSSLWAGPLCSHLLLLEGARVIKVESTTRPDGARADASGFFDLLNHGKSSVALDLPSTSGLSQLRRLLARADVVIEGSRPRALQQWGIDAEALLARDDGPSVWVSITGHGRRGPAAERVGFGDDTAAAAGLLAWDDVGPCFVADAIADPLAGIAAYAEVRDSLAEGGASLVDVALTRVAAGVSGGRVPATVIEERVPPPRARPLVGRAAEVGADTDTVLAERG
jgi:hypothetical protein